MANGTTGSPKRVVYFGVSETARKKLHHMTGRETYSKLYHFRARCVSRIHVYGFCPNISSHNWIKSVKFKRSTFKAICVIWLAEVEVQHVPCVISETEPAALIRQVCNQQVIWIRNVCLLYVTPSAACYCIVMTLIVSSTHMRYWVEEWFGRKQFLVDSIE